MATAVDNATFLVSYPEFAGAPTALLTAKLAQAARRTNADVYQTTTLAADAVMLQAAILLLHSPQGRKMRADAPEQFVVWEYELQKAQRSATIGLRVF